MNREIRDVGQSIESLPAEQRIDRYRQFADAAFLKAQRAQTQEQKAEYLSMASGWHAIAQELERALSGPLQGEPQQTIAVSMSDNPRLAVSIAAHPEQAP